MGFGKLTSSWQEHQVHGHAPLQPHLRARVTRIRSAPTRLRVHRDWDHENTYTTTHQFNWILNQNTFFDIRGPSSTLLPASLPAPERGDLLRRHPESLLGRLPLTTSTSARIPRHGLHHPFSPTTSSAQPRIQGGGRVRAVRVSPRLVPRQSYYVYYADFAKNNRYYYSNSKKQGPPHRTASRERPVGRPGPRPAVLGLHPGFANLGDFAVNLGVRLDIRTSTNPSRRGPSCGMTTPRLAESAITNKNASSTPWTPSGPPRDWAHIPPSTR